MQAPSGSAGGNAFRRCDNIRLHAPVFDRPPFAGAPHAALHFVHDQQDAVFIAQLAQRREESVRRDNVSAFALDRFDQDTRDLIAGYVVTENFLFDETDNRFAVIFTSLRSKIGRYGSGNGTCVTPGMSG